MSAASLDVLQVQSTRLFEEVSPRQKYHTLIWNLIGFSPYHPLVCYSAFHSAKHEDAVAGSSSRFALMFRVLSSTFCGEAIPLLRMDVVNN